MKSFRKKALVFSLILAGILTVWKKQEKENIALIPTSNSPWISYSKDEKGVVKLSEEEHDSKPESTESHSSKRAPASVSPIVPTESSNDKKIVFWNTQGSADKKELNDLDFQNRFDGKWKNFLATNLLNHQPKGTEIHILPVKSIVKILYDNKAMFFEEVIINVRTPQKRGSFKALVNPENGKVTEIWDNSMIDESGERKPTSESIIPTGTL